jgi:hypothetical protein
MAITAEYVQSLPQIYRDVLVAFPQFDPTRKAGYGLSYQSLYSALSGKYTLGQIKLACEQMAQAGFMEIKHAIFATPTPGGEELIAAVTDGEPALDTGVPPFPTPHH